ncbi:MAG: YqgE/AlgH family protein [Opitutales bacterium]|nr:YqgE/AlgH family protein [Opitutales bacterium]MCH8539250.1 YqgE/AlgH family protein [Opitutales bacterium]
MRNFGAQPFDEATIQAGQMLIAHPALPDSNFSRSVILLSAHSEEEGSMGVIVNRPTGQTLASIDPDLKNDILGDIPLFEGGPVQPEQVLLSAWQWSLDEGVFRLFLGIDPEYARNLMQESHMEVRAFKGYAGWGKGQIASELEANSWIVCPINEKTVPTGKDENLWKSILTNLSPEFRLLSEMPEDPEKN